MEIALLIQFGGVFPGKEKAAVEAFTETSKFYGEKLADGTFTYFEPFMFGTGDIRERLGFFIVKGPEEKIVAFNDSKEAWALRTKVAQICAHLDIEYVYTGDRVLEQVNLLGDLAKELEKIPAPVG
ncbi:MAG TPA: hypothetical protein VEK76_01805 [Candidatus Binatia bacterium]|nr:hypothetical protein [Candidatus Binatia bacterium]